MLDMLFQYQKFNSSATPAVTLPVFRIDYLSYYSRMDRIGKLPHGERCINSVHGGLARTPRNQRTGGTHKLQNPT
jgi:hypothetical protein